jgi:hypothetical protein
MLRGTTDDIAAWKMAFHNAKIIQQAFEISTIFCPKKMVMMAIYA